MSNFKIRPHHGLCTAFFEGRGYSADFTENMTKIIGVMEKDDPEITLADGADDICRCCPHNKEGMCNSSVKTDKYDKAVLELCGFSAGDKMRWREFSGAVYEKIIAAGKLESVCGGCSWQDICEKNIKKLKNP